MRRPSGATKASGYSGEHPKIRAMWAPIVATGRAVCRETRCLEAEEGRGRTIHACRKPHCARAGTIHFDWHLAHLPDGSGYSGPAHARCNIAESNRRNPPRGYMRRKTTRVTTSLVW